MTGAAGGHARWFAALAPARLAALLALAVSPAAFALPSCPAPPFIDNFDPAAQPGWTVDTAVNAIPSSAPWTVLADGNARSAPNTYKTDTSSLDEKDDRLVAPPQDLTATSHLIFWHKFITEPDFDGGVLEVSTDGGSSWVDVIAGGGVFVTGGYNGTIDSTFGSRIAGRNAWTGFSQFVNATNKVEVDLGAFAGSARLIRWRYVGDPLAIGSIAGDSWAIDNVWFTNLSCDNSNPENVCVAPGLTRLWDAIGDATDQQAAHDVRKLSVSQPYFANGAYKVAFHLKVASLATIPQDTIWPVNFCAPAFTNCTGATGYAAANKYFTVRMVSPGADNAGTTPIFQVRKPNAADTTRTLVPADASSTFSADGSITIVANATDIGLTAAGAGTQQLTRFHTRVQVGSDASGGATPDNMPDELTGEGSFTPVGNNPCAPPPHMDSLAASPSSGNTPLTVDLIGAASVQSPGPGPANTIASYLFNFGDGSAPLTQAGGTASHLYTATGCSRTYSANVRATDSRNKSSDNTLFAPITVFAANSTPVASLEATPSAGDTLDTITLDASASFDPDEPAACGDRIVTYAFDFGDGGTLTQAGPTADHTYAAPNVYTASVTVVDTHGATSAATAQVTITPVQNRAPVATLTADPTQGLAPLTVDFDASASYDPDAGRTGDSVVQYDFDFGDGSAVQTELVPTATHTFAQPGTYDVRLRVFDSNGLASTSDALVQITALNSPPVAALAASPQNLAKGNPVTFDASGSSDPNGDAIVEYRFSPGDGSPLVTTATPSATHTYARGGTFVASLVAKDARGDLSTVPATVSITVTNTAPVADLSAQPQAGTEPLLVEFDGGGSSDPDQGDAVATYIFDFGDGSAPVTRVGAGTVQHLYSTANAYTVSLTVKDQDGAESTAATILITVASTNRPPVARLSADRLAGNLPLAVRFDAGGSSDTDGDAVSEYTFSFGDGTPPVTQSAPVVSHTYAAEGRYLAYATVRDARGAQSSNSDAISIEVTTAPAINDTGEAFEDKKGPFSGALSPWLLAILALLGAARRARRPAFRGGFQ